MSIKKYAILFLKSILGGAMIGIASVIYLKNQSIIGAVLFSIGILVIMSMGLKLFTGAVGRIKFLSAQLPIILVGNLIGTFFMSLYANSFLGLHKEVLAIFSEKLSHSNLHVFISAIICGIFIYVSIQSHEKYRNFLITIFCITAFVMFGADHSIANSFYFFSAGITWLSMINLFLCIVGNIIGAYICKFLMSQESENV